MEQFLLDNAGRYQSLIQRFKPPRQKVNKHQDEGVSPSISVAARIRPMLEEEVLSGQVVAASARDGEPEIVDVHELRRVIRGLPTINVCEVPILIAIKHDYLLEKE